MDKDFAARLKEAVVARVGERLNALGLKPEQACKAAGLSRDTIRNMRRDPELAKNLPRLDTLAQLAPALGVSASWLAYGEGPQTSIDSRIISVPVTNRLRAGVWLEATDKPIDVPPVFIPRPEGILPGTLYAAIVEGASMDRIFPDGSIVVLERTIDSGQDIVDKRIYHVERVTAEGLVEDTIKRAVRDETGKIWLRPESHDPRFSAAIPATPERGGDIRFVGYVINAIIQF